MDALILSCSTGGGHNAAGRAVKEELERRGHRVTMLDPYSLAGRGLDKKVGNGYIRLAQKTPRFFGFIYWLGEMYRSLPIHSPVYRVNRAMCRRLKEYLSEQHFDVIIFPHIYPGEMLTYMKNKGINLPKTIFIATDYTCIPFTEELDCDYFVIPSSELNSEFIKRGIDSEKLVCAGIPVRREFGADISREEAIKRLGLDEKKRYLLLSGGSIGAGGMSKTLRILLPHLAAHPERQLIVICGSNQTLLKKLQKRYGSSANITLLPNTDKMALYMKACDVFLSKPGGLSSTEAAVAGIPLVHLSPIPGCETKNMAYFSSRGMSLSLGKKLRKLPFALSQLEDAELAAEMRQSQRMHVSPSAAADICRLAEAAVNEAGRKKLVI